MSNLIRVADYVFQFLAKQGVKHVFLVSGGGAMHLNDALVQNSDIEYVPMHHEQACGIAAEAYGRIDGGFGVALVTTGPGATNAITPVTGAWIESLPMMVVSGQVKRSDLNGDSGLRQKGVQGCDIIPMVKGVTKYAITVMDPASIRYHLEKAVYLAMEGRPGPVWIDIPLDVQGTKIDPAALEGFTPEAKPDQSKKLQEQANRVVQLINEAQRPLLMLGNGVRVSGAAKEIEQLYETLGIPVVTTWNAMDLIPGDHRLNVGRPGAMALRPPNFAVQNSDLLITIGARLDNVVTAFNPSKFGRAARKVIVDVDPVELGKFDMPIEESVCADAREFINAMLAAASNLKEVDRSPWLKKCAEWKRKYPAGDGKPFPSSGPISHYHLMDALSKAIPENMLVVTGTSGMAIEVFYMTYQNKVGQRMFLTAGLGSMGYGLPAIVGAAMKHGEAPFVAIESDGSLIFNMQELLTIKQFNIPMRLIILNNDGYVSIRNSQKHHFNGRYIGTGPESKVLIPDMVAVGESIGIPGIRIDDAAELEQKLAHTLKQPGPFICDVRLVSHEALVPKCSAAAQADGSMISMPLEDMTPLLPRQELRENMLIELDPASEKVSV